MPDGNHSGRVPERHSAVSLPARCGSTPSLNLAFTLKIECPHFLVSSISVLLAYGTEERGLVQGSQ